MLHHPVARKLTYVCLELEAEPGAWAAAQAEARAEKAEARAEKGRGKGTLGAARFMGSVNAMFLGA